jgi:hypothetical protein
MSDKQTRGAFVRNAIILPAFAGLLAGTAGVASAQAKGAKSTYKYQDEPKDGKQCSQCTFFLQGKTETDAGTCKIVDGTISPKGWCIAWSSKSG